MGKIDVKKIFGFFILLIAIIVVGIELLLSIGNSYGAQMDRRIKKFKETKVVYNGELPLIKKIVKMDSMGMITTDNIVKRIVRKKVEDESTPRQASTSTNQQSGTSGGGGEAAATGDSGSADASADAGSADAGSGDSAGEGGAEEAAPAGVSQTLKDELNKQFKKLYQPSQNDITKFTEIVNGLTSDENANLLKEIIAKKVRVENVLRFDDEFFKGLKKLYAVLSADQKKAFIELLNDRLIEYKSDGLDRLVQVIEYYKTEEVKKMKLKMNTATFKLYGTLCGQETDLVSAAMKYLYDNEVDAQSKMRFLKKPTYKWASWVITAIFIAACVFFLLRVKFGKGVEVSLYTGKDLPGIVRVIVFLFIGWNIWLINFLVYAMSRETSRVIIMLFGMVKIAFLLTVPIIFLGFISGILVFLSVVVILLTFVSMYKVELKKA